MGEIWMSQLTHEVAQKSKNELEKMAVTIRGKLQFMDYLVWNALSDLDRFNEEEDPGAKAFLRQLVEMHTSNLVVESENMGLLSELCENLESIVSNQGEGV